MQLKMLTFSTAITIAILTLLASTTPRAMAGVVYQTGFEPPTFSTGTISGQDGWGSATPSETVVESSVVKSGLQAISITPAVAN